MHQTKNSSYEINKTVPNLSTIPKEYPKIYLEEHTDRTQNDVTISNLTQELFQMQTDYSELKKRKGEQELYFQNKLEKASSEIMELRNENSLLNQKLNEQVKLYNALLANFQAQQLLIENKSMKITAQIERMNEFAEEIMRLKVFNTQMEDEITRLKSLSTEREKEYANPKGGNFSRIEKLKNENQILIEENSKLCQDNVEMNKELKRLKERTYQYEKGKKTYEKYTYNDI